MKNDRPIRWSIFALVGVWMGCAGAPTERMEPRIALQADDLMRRMSQALTQTSSFRFEATDTMEEVLESGQKIQYSHTRNAVLSRPYRMKVESVGDFWNRTFWKDGQTLTLLDHDLNEYQQMDDPGTIDEAMEYLMEHYEVSVPLADLLSADPYRVMMARVRTGEYMGLHHVGRIRCHHLAFTQETVDWQIWIDAAETPIPRKMVITYKLLAGQPQYTVTLTSVETIEEPADSIFEFDAPEGAKRVEFNPVSGIALREETGP